MGRNCAEAIQERKGFIRDWLEHIGTRQRVHTGEHSICFVGGADVQGEVGREGKDESGE